MVLNWRYVSTIQIESLTRIMCNSIFMQNLRIEAYKVIVKDLLEKDMRVFSKFL